MKIKNLLFLLFLLIGFLPLSSCSENYETITLEYGVDFDKFPGHLICCQTNLMGRGSLMRYSDYSKKDYCELFPNSREVAFSKAYKYKTHYVWLFSRREKYRVDLEYSNYYASAASDFMFITETEVNKDYSSENGNTYYFIDIVFMPKDEKYPFEFGAMWQYERVYAENL